MPLSVAPCDWPMPDPSTCCTAWAKATDADKDRARALAVYLLWAATGRAYGRCSTTIRPCSEQLASEVDWPVRPDGRLYAPGWYGAVSGAALPDLVGAQQWRGGLCGRHGTACSCAEFAGVDLPGWLPEPTEVRVDGAVVPLDEFRVDSARWLVWQDQCPRTGCPHRFPAGQNLALPTSCAGTWSVTYDHGIPVPAAGQAAAADLACELVKSCTPGAGDCRLPSNVRAIHRQGVDIEYFSSTTGGSGMAGTVAVTRLRFNVPSVDLWVQAVNPWAVTQPATAWSPDVPSPRFQSWP